MSWFDRANRRQMAVSEVRRIADERKDDGGKLTLLNTASADIVESHAATYHYAKTQLLQEKEDLERDIQETIEEHERVIAEKRMRLAGTITAIEAADAGLIVLRRGEAVLARHRTPAQAESSGPVSGETDEELPDLTNAELEAAINGFADDSAIPEKPFLPNRGTGGAAKPGDD